MKSSIVLVLIFCLFTITSLFAQGNDIKNDSLQVEELYAKAIEIKDNDLVEAKKKFESAIEIIDKSLLSKDEFLLKKASILEQLAYFLRRENKFGPALKNLQESLKLKRKIGETYTLGYTYSQTAWLWLYQSEFEKTKVNLDSAYALSKKYNNTIEIIRTLSRYGILYLNIKDSTKAEQHHLLAIKLADSINETKSIAATNANYAFFLRRQKRYKENIPYLERAVEMHQKANNQIGLESGYFALGVTYRVLGMPHKAIELYNKTLVMSKEQKNEAVLHSRYLGLSNSYADLKDYEKAYSYHLEYTKWWIKVKNEKNYQKMVDLETKYKYEQQLAVDSLKFAQEKREVELVAQTESSKKKLYFALLLVTLIGGGVIGYLIRRNYQQRSKLAKATYENEKKILDQKINAKEEDIKRLVADNSMRLAFKEELLDKIKNEVIGAEPENIKKSLSSLTTQLRLQIETESKLSGLQEKIEVVNKSFDTKLQKLYPELTKGEREVCALLRLNLSIKEIMTIRNVSSDSVKSMRRRIRKKMQVSSEIELEKFIQELV
ncbi:tetratricopeptide repeat protein [Aquimarina sp. MAR_2010_214]|uniref:tetratricopeptide repeat protein n=1 Tax=Aquimarina sp. MAR_2010_214 TaxID=1250026 RepID=UPI000CCACB47|nr:tetratricopeptide repeat protein [Aquimarina sp. MAR_2010_214]PKV49196.1 tetratricopeptide repeat protein [Aquimarina sp. MAR_2010_214]